MIHGQKSCQSSHDIIQATQFKLPCTNKTVIFRWSLVNLKSPSPASSLLEDPLHMISTDILANKRKPEIVIPDHSYSEIPPSPDIAIPLPELYSCYLSTAGGRLGGGYNLRMSKLQAEHFTALWVLLFPCQSLFSVVKATTVFQKPLDFRNNAAMSMSMRQGLG